MSASSLRMAQLWQAGEFTRRITAASAAMPNDINARRRRGRPAVAATNANERSTAAAARLLALIAKYTDQERKIRDAVAKCEPRLARRDDLSPFATALVQYQDAFARRAKKCEREIEANSAAAAATTACIDGLERAFNTYRTASQVVIDVLERLCADGMPARARVTAADLALGQCRDASGRVRPVPERIAALFNTGDGAAAPSPYVNLRLYCANAMRTKNGDDDDDDDDDDGLKWTYVAGDKLDNDFEVVLVRDAFVVVAQEPLRPQDLNRRELAAAVPIRDDAGGQISPTMVTDTGLVLFSAMQTLFDITRTLLERVTGSVETRVFIVLALGIALGVAYIGTFVALAQQLFYGTVTVYALYSFLQFVLASPSYTIAANISLESELATRDTTSSEVAAVDLNGESRLANEIAASSTDVLARLSSAMSGRVEQAPTRDVLGIALDGLIDNDDDDDVVEPDTIANSRALRTTAVIASNRIRELFTSGRA